MPTPFRSCRRSSPSRLEWRPSRLQGAAQLAALIAVPWLLQASALPHALYWPVLAAVWAVGLAELLWRLYRPRRVLLLPSLPAPLQVAGQDIDSPRLLSRGPWLLLRWRQQGRRRHLLFWPDVLDRAQRRELRLAVAARAVSRQPRTVAP
ncbi:hypothetical protein C1922_08105 [Stenotrophomonas sp. ZAC14D2_NAIMI4_7]|uniref:hypothetical protein n=1 Tax=Stenotrophomonas sp. ZAC14D2_NAIMI4_7 TaxID=2072405 RepID=UPI000D53F54C|nr:hypothetical protein [Stenotrophomonas sp. ZAC14D2_NAIMI4_7]AWH17274.1 hypothetical protein C1922_08105 [Stenotrophomonas sp. ZAC14D2_NAIMI4_7]